MSFGDDTLDPTNVKEAAPADPAAIDLEVLEDRAHYGTHQHAQDIHRLIAAVEALRERVAGLESTTNDWIEAGILRGHRADQAEAKTEAAEARVAALARALERAARALQETADWLADEPEPHMGTVHGIRNDASAARTVLADTPTEALERARAVENCISALRYYARNEVGQVVKDALIKLDALDKEKKKDA